MKDPMDGTTMVDLALRRIMIRDDSERQYIFLQENGGKRSFLIVIGTNEAQEIQRVVLGHKPERPLTHQLAYDAIRALGADLKRVDIVDMRSNTYYAQIVLQNTNGELTAVVDARCRAGAAREVSAAHRRVRARASPQRRRRPRPAAESGRAARVMRTTSALRRRA
jgi:bifunctional DNase/RNase